MKLGKQIFITTVLLLVAVISCFGHIIDLETGSYFQYNAELVEVSPVVDGVLNDTPWQEVRGLGEMEQEIMDDTQWQGSSDFDGSFVAVWRRGFLYIAIRLTDDHLETHDTKLSQQDHLVVYLDPDHNGHKSDLYRYNLPVGENDRLFPAPLTAVAWGDDGQSCELMFNLGHLADKGNSVGFWIYYNDVDEGRLRHRISWGPAGYTIDDQLLPDLVFVAKIEPNRDHKILQWGQIKSLLGTD
jgi:hypothetical protein